MANPASSSRSRTCAATVDFPEPSVPTSATTTPCPRRPSGDACRPAGAMVCRWRHVLAHARGSTVARMRRRRALLTIRAVGVAPSRTPTTSRASGEPRPRRHPSSAAERCATEVLAHAARASSTRESTGTLPRRTGRIRRSAAAAAPVSCGASPAVQVTSSAGISVIGPTRRSPWVRSMIANPESARTTRLVWRNRAGSRESATGAAGSSRHRRSTSTAGSASDAPLPGRHQRSRSAGPVSDSHRTWAPDTPCQAQSTPASRRIATRRSCSSARLGRAIRGSAVGAAWGDSVMGCMPSR